MKFIAPILQYVIAALLLALIGGAWSVYADVQNVKTKVQDVDELTTDIRSLHDAVTKIPVEIDALKTSVRAIEKRVDRRLADVPLCRRR